MENKINPSPLPAILFGGLTAVLSVIAAIDYKTGGELSYELILGSIGCTISFIYYLCYFIFTTRIKFDDNTFTVKGNTYRFSQISEAKVTHKRMWYFGRRLRSHTYIKIKLYIRDECICSFCEEQEGADEFIALLKRHRVKFHIKNSLSSWKGEIE